MTEEERIDCFLTVFKDLEKELVRISRLKDDYISFSRALNHIYYNRMNPVVSQRDCYDFLKTASDLRNILSHENDVCAPSEKFTERFQRISSAILSPYSCYDVCTKRIESCGLSSHVLEAMRIMDSAGLSHLPVLDGKGRVVGVFSRSTLFDKILRKNDFVISSELTMNDLSDVIGLSSHTNEDFFFVARHTSVLSAFGMTLKRKAHDRQVGLLLVTEHGKPKEKLLGVITSTDLAKLSLSESN